jgi:hypothetical protein
LENGYDDLCVNQYYTSEYSIQTLENEFLQKRKIWEKEKRVGQFS